ncbi:ABC transporter permease [Mycoplasma phocoenae]|uniref:ABC transporter permease n=1 Tax=Mycoplasma phocoenae TaxID=754517 RepID=A0A858U7W0_9MOLU|nr:ABC transporter permease [Mycoplasma phocoenae]QJG66858.1 ABC transporter permease [Mycoplasma phocoenae]
MNSTDFNQKYKIGINLQSKIKFIGSEHQHSSSNIAGKPKKMLVEIIKRFFKNPYVTFAFICFVTLMLCAIIIPLTTPYKAMTQINNIDKMYTTMLPPIFSPMVEKTEIFQNSPKIDKFYEIKQFVEEHPDLQIYFANFLNTTRFGEFNAATGTISMQYDAYALFDAVILHNAMAQKITEDANFVFTQAWVNDIKIQNPVNTLLGTDINAQDIWTNAWTGTAESIKIAIITASLQTLIGVAIGAYLGFHVGKWIDTVFMRLIEIFLAPPTLIWLLLFVSVMGVSNTALIISLVITGWAWPVSSTRMFIITVKDEEYITAAKSIGASTSRQIFVHALPAILGKIATAFVRRIPSIILSIASLAFLGFYKDGNSANLGKLLLEATPQAPENYWILLLPSIILLTLSLSLQFIAIGVHDALDPKVISSSKK